MPAKNRIKTYSENGYYHIYNRGVSQAEIFINEADYAVFLSYLKEYLLAPQPPTEAEIEKRGYFYLRKNYQQEIELIAFVLMPNHFHLLIKQNHARSIEGFMRSLCTRYSVYFNKHYQRVGHVFQDIYKGILINQESYYLWLTRYIHRNPLEILKDQENLSDYPYSSYPTYIGRRKCDWIHKDMVIKTTGGDYRSFVEGEYGEYGEEPSDLSTITLE